MGGNSSKRPAVPVVQSLPNGQALVSLPDEYAGDVVLHCQGGIVHKYNYTGYGRPLGHEVELTETTSGRKA